VERGNDLLDQAQKAAARGDEVRTNTLLTQAAAVRGVLSSNQDRIRELVVEESNIDISTVVELPEVKALEAGSSEAVRVRYGSDTLSVTRDGDGNIRASLRGGDSSLIGIVLAQSRRRATESAQERATSAMSTQTQRAASIKAALANKIAEQQRRQRASTRDARLASASNQ
jgi:hypothetical protein